jgi:hypothetical protein
MSRKFQSIIRYNRPATADKAMGVADLAPSLLALSDLIKIANQYANGDRAGVKVLVNANLEQHCFELGVFLDVTIWEQAKILLADERVKTAKEILEWVGLVKPAIGFTLFCLVKFLRGKKVASVTVVRISDGHNEVEIRVEGEADPIRVQQQVFDLYSNLEARRRASEVMRPLRLPDYTSLEFQEGDEVVFQAGPEDAPQPDLSDLPEVIPQNLNRSTIRTVVRIRKAAYEGTARWTLMYKRAIDAPIDDADWLARFQAAEIDAPPGSSLDVELEETYITSEIGEVLGDPTYRVLKVHGVIKPPEQTRLEFRDETRP